MELLIKIITLAAGPVIGALIGLFTNYIAVKMLFRPYTEKRIGKLKIPFTPGIIPRRQAALAKALGHMIEEDLVRKEDLKSSLCSDEVCQTVTNAILSLPPLAEAGAALAGESYAVQRERALNALTNKIVTGLQSFDLVEIFKREGVAALSTIKNPLISMFVTENTVSNIATPMAGRVAQYLEGDGKLKLRELLEAELKKLEAKPIGDLLGDRAQTAPLIGAVYRRLVNDHADAIVARIHIAEIVESRVRAMSPRDIEALFLSVMKKELNAVVYLGGAIGLVMGVITLLTNLL